MERQVQQNEKPQEPAEMTDNELLMRFVRHRDQAAFRELVERHASLVMGACRHLSRHEKDAEDAFQATILILAKRAHRLLHVTSLAGWLHRVAYRTALRAVKQRSRRREDHLPAEPAMKENDALHEVHVRELQQILHQELENLPARYRDAIALCDLEGRTRAQAADHLDCTEFAVKAALARGRRQLRMRLLRRGVVLSFAMAVTKQAIASVPVSAGLIEQAVGIGFAYGQGAASGTSQSVTALAKESEYIMSLGSVSRALAAGVVAAVLCVIPLVLLAQISTGSGAPQTVSEVEKTLKAPAPKNTGGAQGAVTVERPEFGAEDPSGKVGVGPAAKPAPARTRSITLDSGTFVLVQVRGTNLFQAYNKADGRWDKHLFPKGVKAVPIVDGGFNQAGVAAFHLSGDGVKELVAVDEKGRFRTHKLAKPLNRPLIPILDGSLCYYIADGKIFAFSAKKGTWDSLNAPQFGDLAVKNGVVSVPQPQADGFLVAGDTLVVEFPDKIAAFSVASGKWSEQKFGEAAKK